MGERDAEVDGRRDGCVGGDDIDGGDAGTSATRARVLSNPARAAARGERRAAHNVFDTLRPRRACLAASSPRLSCPRHARGDNERARGVRRQHAAVAGTPYGPRLPACVC